MQRLRGNIAWLILLISPFILIQNLDAQILVNNGAQVTVKEDALVGVLGGLLVTEGSFDNGGYVWVDGDVENNDTITGYDKIMPIPSSTYVLRGDWINNGVFIASQGLVEMDTTLEQLITGTVPSVFHDLSLLGSDLYNVKRQTIDAFIDPTGTLQVNDAELATDNSRMFVTNRANTAVTHGEGFVSSLGDAYISWEMNSPSTYEFPVGSSLGVLRKRVARLTPGASLNTMGVRFANVDATTEGYDIDMREQQICDINRLYYHRLYRLSGPDAMNIDLEYVLADDGDWDFMVNWENSPAREWSETDGSSSDGLFVSVDSWSAFTDTAFAYGRPLQAILTANPTNICEGDNASLTVSGTTGPAMISWLEPIDPSLPSGAVNLPLTFTVSPTQTTQYVVEVTANGCTVSDTAVVTVDPPTQLSISIAPDPAVSCDNSPFIFTADTSGGGPTGVISWFVNGALQPGENGVQFVLVNPNTGDVVRAEYTTLAGCSGNASSNPVTITTGDAVSVSLSGDDLICVPQDESIGIFADITSPPGSNVSISWASEAELTCNSGCSATYVTPPTGDTVWVYVTVTDLVSGCTDVDSIQVCGLDVPGIYIPTAFTPDGDTDNDDLYILGDLEEFELNEFRIYNRWGEMIFSATSFNEPWDGTFKGEDQEMDVYVYYVSANFRENDEKRELKGNVLLLR